MLISIPTKQYMKIQIVLYPYQNFSLSVLCFSLLLLVWSVISLSFCLHFPRLIRLFFVYGLFKYSLLWSAYSNLLPIFQLGCLLFSYGFMDIVYIFWMQIPCYMCCKYLFPLCCLPFNFLNDIFWWIEVFNSNKSSLSLFFYDYIFTVLLKEAFPIQGSYIILQKFYFCLLILWPTIYDLELILE